MSQRKGKEQQAIGIVDAVETLSTLADLELDREFTVSQKHEYKIGNKKLIYRTIHWLEENEEDKALLLIKDVFQTVLGYIKKFYTQEVKVKGKLASQKAIEGIKDIMVLVGEAAQKLDKVSKILNSSNVKSFRELKEYQLLQSFYQKKIAKKGGEAEQTLTRLFSFAKDVLVEQLHHGKVKSKILPKKELNRVFIDFDSVKKDSDYELLLIKKENGDPFYSTKLLRNMKLVSDFGEHLTEKISKDPLVRLPFWLDKKFQTSAKELVETLKKPMEKFYQSAMRFKDTALVAKLNSAMMALMLSANSYNLLSQHPAKSCREYFADFYFFLRSSLNSAEFKRLEESQDGESRKAMQTVVSLTRAICNAIFHGLKGDRELVPIIHRLIESSAPDPLNGEKDESFEDNLAHRLSSDYESLTSLFKSSSEGPMNKMLEMLDSKVRGFDPLLQENHPSVLYDLFFGDHKVTCVRLGAPVVQEWINQAAPSPEFISFLKQGMLGPNLTHHLMINLQDRTSWIEHARCICLEDLPKQEDIDGALTVVTLATETDFYFQREAYEDVNNASDFKKIFMEQLHDPHSGFYFPENLKKKVVNTFAKKILGEVHTTFFGGRKKLLQEERRRFIDLVYQLLVFKCIEIVQPDTFSFTCKDGIDKSSAFNGMFYFLCKVLKGEDINPLDFDIFNLMLHVPGLSIRERPIRPESFFLMKTFIEYIEKQPEKGKKMWQQLKKVKGLFLPATLNPLLEQI